MSRIQINLDHAQSVSGDLNQKFNRLPNVKSSISSMVYQVDSQIAGRRNIRSRLNRVSHSTQELEMRLRELKVFIDSSLDQYRRTEALLVQMSLGIAGIQSISYYGSNGRAGANRVSLAYDFIGPPVYKDGSMNSCPAPTPEPKLNPFMKAWKSIQGIGSDLYDAAENRADHAGDSFPAFLDYLSMGIPSGAYKAAEDRANRMMDSPFDFVNWATLGISGMADEALFPDDPLSKEHLSSSFGLASLLAGGTLAASGRSSFSMRTSKGDTGSSSIKETGNLNYKKISETPAEDVNKWWKEEMGYTEPPYKPGTLTQYIELTDKTTFVRVYDGENSGMYGGWFMKAEDIKGLTPTEIQNKFALPTTPKFVADVELDSGTNIRTGTVNPLFGFDGEGQQFDLMGQRVGNFVNPRPLP